MKDEMKAKRALGDPLLILFSLGPAQPHTLQATYV
jgi:hypothetical protein